MCHRIGWTWRFVQPARALSSKMVAIEATGGFEAVVAAGLAGAGLPVLVVNPAQVRAFAQTLGKRAKTDPIDANRDHSFRRSDQAEAAANAGRDDKASSRSGRSPAPNRRDDRRRRSAGTS